MKRYIIIASAVLVLLGVVYVVIESGKIDLLNSLIPEKIAVFKNVHLSGVFSSGEAWDVTADSAWTGRNRLMTTLDDVSDASIEKKGRYIVKGLKARRVTMNSAKDIEVIKKVGDEPEDRQYMLAYIDFGAVAKPVKKEKKFYSLTADYIKFNPDKKTALIYGGVSIRKKDFQMESEKVTIDLDRNVATFESRSIFRNEKAKMSSDRSIAFLDVDRLEMSGSIEVSQKNKEARSPSAVYNDKDKTVTLTGNVVALIKKPSAAMKGSAAEKYKSDEAKTILETETAMYCDDLTIDTDSNDSQAAGHVDVKQKEKEARSDNAYYSDKDGTIVMTGSVNLKKKDSWIKADKVIVYVDKEIFEAFGGVETTFNVKKPSR